MNIPNMSIFLMILITLSAAFTNIPVKGCNNQCRTRSIFILAGQSNMVGYGGFYKLPNGTGAWDRVVPPECQPDPLISRLNGNLSFEEATQPLFQSAGIGPGMPFARSVLEREPGIGEIGLVPCAVGGTNISLWARGADLYNNMTSRARAAVALGGVIRALLWYQGEADTGTQEAATVYKARLQQFISDVRKDLAMPSLPVIEVAITSGFNWTYVNIVREAQIETAAEVGNVGCVDALGLQLGLDHMHLTTDAQVQLGKKLADAYLSVTAPKLN